MSQYKDASYPNHNSIPYTTNGFANNHPINPINNPHYLPANIAQNPRYPMRNDDNHTDPLLGISTSAWDRQTITEKTLEPLKELDAGIDIHAILPTIESIAFDSLTYTIDEEMEQRMVQ